MLRLRNRPTAPSSRTRRPTAALSVAAAVCAVALAGCGGSEDAPAEEGGPAEPAEAPELTTDPAGTVAEVAPLPQGIVYASGADQLAVAVHDPYRLLLLDPDTLEIENSVELPGKVRHLQVAGPDGPVLVPSETANQLFEVSLPTGETRTTDVGEHPHDATADDGKVYVGDEFSGTITVVEDGSVVGTIDDLTQPGSVNHVGDTLVAVDVEDYTLTTYDPKTLERTGRVNAGEGPTHAVPVGGNRVAVADTRGGQVLIFSVDPLRQVAAVPTAGSPYGLTSDPRTGMVWVTSTETNELIGIDAASDDPQVTDTYPTVRQPDTVAVAPGSRTLWVTGTVDGVVERITR